MGSDDSVIHHLSRETYDDLLTRELLADGILPKLENAFAALDAEYGGTNWPGVGPDEKYGKGNGRHFDYVITDILQANASMRKEDSHAQEIIQRSCKPLAGTHCYTLF